MATTKKKPTRKRKRVSGTAAAVGKIKISGATFTKTSCHTTKTAAKKAADSIRAKGNKARVVKSAGGVTCVYKGSKISSKAPMHLRRRAA